MWYGGLLVVSKDSKAEICSNEFPGGFKGQQSLKSVVWGFPSGFKGQQS